MQRTCSRLYAVNLLVLPLLGSLETCAGSNCFWSSLISHCFCFITPGSYKQIASSSLSSEFYFRIIFSICIDVLHCSLILVVVTHTKVNGFPKVNSTREIRYQGALGHTLNIIPRSIIHTWLVSARNAKMNKSRELAGIISLLLLVLFRQSSTALFCQCFIQQRIRKRRVRLRFINSSAHSQLCEIIVNVHALLKVFGFFHIHKCGFSSYWTIMH